tara:strand:- start:41541 stop:42698 length:1158 start_codon:yes stop_codon:yes gene_type:complete
MKKKRTICVISSSRADYNHLYLLLKDLRNNKEFKLQLVVTGMHLLAQYGYTYKELLDDGFSIDERITISAHGDTTNNLLKSMSKQLSTSYRVFNKLSPDIIVILGDRYDVLPIAIAANIMGIPIAHIHGGEVTEGVIDDSIRHCLTKLSHIHLVATKQFKKRVRQLGENENNIFCIGSLGVASLSQVPKITKNNLVKHFKIKQPKKYFVICIHPETIGKNNKALIDNTLNSLNKFDDYGLVFSYPNSDPGNDYILTKIKNFIKLNNHRSILIKSAGRKYFINLIKHSNGIIGNSSTGIVEAPALCIPTINIGNRQKGRPITKSIISTQSNTKSINNAIIKSQLTRIRKEKKLQYVNQKSIKDILKIFKKVNLDTIIEKKFSDINI